jgi:hypothetical protein
MLTEKISSKIDSLVSENQNQPLAPEELKSLLEQVSQIAFSEGKTYALANLLDQDQVAQEFGVSRTRAQALIKNRHDRLGVGLKIGGAWVVSRDDLEALRPGPVGKPKKA